MNVASMRRLGSVSSMRRPWWTMRSIIADTSLSSARTVPHFENLMLAVIVGDLLL